MFDILPGIDPLAVTKVAEFAVFIAVVSMCAAVLYLVYRKVSSKEADDVEFASTIFILTIAIGLLVSIIKHAPAISFGLFGAMSIVRFRSQIKRPQRMIFIFMAAAIGVCCGAGEYLTTIMGTAVLSALTVATFSFAPPRIKSKLKLEAKAMPSASPLSAKGGEATSAVNQSRWGLDLLPAYLGDGQRVRVLVIVDEVSREALAAIPETSLSGARVIGELDRLIVERGKPHTVVSEGWPQLASKAVTDWKQATAIEWHWLDQTTASETFISQFAPTVRDQCLAGPTYANLIQARTGLETWRLAYNKTIENSGAAATRTERPQDQIGPRLAVRTPRESMVSILQASETEIEPLALRAKSASAL